MNVSQFINCTFISHVINLNQHVIRIVKPNCTFVSKSDWFKSWFHQECDAKYEKVVMPAVHYQDHLLQLFFTDKGNFMGDNYEHIFLLKYKNPAMHISPVQFSSKSGLCYVK